MYILLVSVIVGFVTGQQEGEWLNDTSDLPADMPHQDFVGADSLYMRKVLKKAAKEAVEYFMTERDLDNGWGAFTPRAIAALSIADKELPLSDEDKQSIQKQLNIQLLLDFMENKTTMSLSSLALYINALHATCQDPRNFQGIDLVDRLRWGVDNDLKSYNHSIPLAMLTLCLSNKVTRRDSYVLANMYNKKEFSRTGSRALLMMAMICMMRREGSSLFQNFEIDFASQEFVAAQTADIYSQALYIQAMNALGLHNFSVATLLNNQLSDGSFGDMLSTYYAIPALLNSSLLDLKCGNRNKGDLERMTARANGENEIAYSLWIPSGQDINSHSLSITFDGGNSFFDIMNMAASRNNLYRFSYDESDSNGKVIYSIAGIPNDIERGSSWVLYSGNIDSVKVNSVEGLTQEFIGVDRIFPEDRNHFVFWLKGDSGSF